MARFADPDKPEYCSCGADMWKSMISGRIIRMCDCYKKALAARRREQIRGVVLAKCSECKTSGYDGTCAQTEKLIALSMTNSLISCLQFLPEHVTRSTRTR